MKMGLERRLFAGFWVVLVLFAVTIYFSYKNYKLSLESDRWVAHTHETMYHLSKIKAQILDLEKKTALLVVYQTDSLELLTDYEIIHIPRNLQGLRHLIADNGPQQRNTDTLELYFEKESANIIAIKYLINNGAPQKARKNFISPGFTDVSKKIMQKIVEMQSIEQALLSERNKVQEEQFQNYNYTFYLLLSLILLLFVVGYFMTRRSISAFIKTEEKLQLQAYMIDSSNDPIVATDTNLIIIAWNRAAEFFYGYSEHEAIGKHLMELNGNFKQVTQDEIYKHIEKTGYWHGEVVQHNRQNEEVPTLMSLAVMKNVKNESIGYIAVYKNIAEIKKTEVKLKNTNDFLDTILDHIPIMMFVKEAKELRFVMFNKAGQEMIGFMQNELLGKNDHDFFTKEEADFFTAKDREVLDSGKLLEIQEEPIHTNYNGMRWLHTKKIPIIDADGKRLYLLGISEDITERKENEDKIKRLNNELEQNIVQLEASNKELESFSYSVSHDLRAPLRAIDGYARILEEDYGQRLDGEAMRLLGVIMKNARKMGQLIDDLLAFSRLGKREIVKHLVSMTDLAKTAAKDLQEQPQYQNAVVKIPTLEVCIGDFSLLMQVWANLISNALKYSRSAEKPYIEIGSYIDGGQVVYFIKDNGVGFDMAYYDKLFGTFQRLHDMKEFEGTGVGLAIVKRIIVKHNGKVWAEAAPNKGATFYFSLPVR